MSKALQQAAAAFPAFNWNTATPEELRGDLLAIELHRQLVALGGQIVEKDGQLVVARSDHDYMDLFDSDPRR